MLKEREREMSQIFNEVRNEKGKKLSAKFLMWYKNRKWIGLE